MWNLNKINKTVTIFLKSSQIQRADYWLPEVGVKGVGKTGQLRFSVCFLL